MAEVHDLGELAHISAEAIGEPGQRRFRLLVMNGRSESAILWMEKEQLDALGSAIETALRDEGYTYETPPLDDVDLGFSEAGGLEFRVGRLTMGINRDAQAVLLFATDGPSERESEYRVEVAFNFRRAHELRGQIAETVAAGRPPCPLCGGPINPGRHVCVRANGHQPQ